jgi:hypothetical protein
MDRSRACHERPWSSVPIMTDSCDVRRMAQPAKGDHPMFGSSCLGRRLGLSIALVVAMASGARASGTMGLPIAQVSLTELQATQQARQQMEGNAAGAAAGARPQMNPDNAVPAPAGGNDATPDAGATGGGGGILKYLPAYFLIVLFTGLGIAAVGRPVRRLPPDGT